MDNDRALKTELRQALDEVLPPAPWLEAAVRDDLRKRRSGGYAGSGSLRGWRAWPRPSMQLAAGLLILAVAAAAVATFIGLRNLAPRSEPAALSVTAYQKMVGDDTYRLASAGNGIDCSTLQSTCPAPGKPVLTAYQRLLDDVKGSQPPARFAVIDAQLRRHLAAAISDLNGVFAAYRAQDQGGLDRANYLLNAQGDWVFAIANAIIQSHQGNAATYIASVRTGKQGLAACDSCDPLVRIGSSECVQIQSLLCEADVVYATVDIDSVETALVTVAAPSSLAGQDALLQRDLAQADNAVLAMATAQLTGDQAGFDAGRVRLQQALPAVDADLAGILGR